MTAKALVRQREEGLSMHELTAVNIRKVTRYRENGETELEHEVKRLEDEKKRVDVEEKDVYEKEGTRVEWITAANAGPGKMRKKKVKKDAP